MSTERWTPLNYTNDSKIPLVGEVILLRYPTSTIYFPHGPASAVLASSHAYTGFSSTATGNPKGVRSIMHYILILDVSHDKKNRTGWEVDHGVVESGLDVNEISFGEDAFQED